MKINLTILMENAILGALVEQMNEEGYRVVTSKEDQAGYLWVYGIKNNKETKPKGGYDYWIKCSPGNGKDFIVDFTTNLDEVLKPVHEFCEMFE